MLPSVHEPARIIRYRLSLLVAATPRAVSKATPTSPARPAYSFKRRAVSSASTPATHSKPKNPESRFGNLQGSRSHRTVENSQTHRPFKSTKEIIESDRNCVI